MEDLPLKPVEIARVRGYSGAQRRRRMEWPRIIFAAVNGTTRPQLACSSECQENHECVEINFFPGLGVIHAYGRLRVCRRMAQEQKAGGVAEILLCQQFVNVPAEIADTVRYQLAKAGY